MDSQTNKVKWNDEYFSFSTIEECETYFERNYEQIVEIKEHSVKLHLLRSCIELLNRLEDTPHHLFAGRVLIFLARVIPLFDESGLNLKSEFSHLNNVPSNVIKTLEQINKQTAEKDRTLSQLIDQDIEEGETLSDDDSNDLSPIEDSDKIFERFWKIQNFLGRPNQLYDKNIWFTFRTSVDALIYKMENNPATLSIWELKDSYMTDSKTFALQISDINMRRCFLVQILIVMQYLEQSDTRPDNLVLDKAQSSWIATITKRIYSLLDLMPNQEEGRKFLSLVRHVLRREEMWNKWKNDKCKKSEKSETEDDIVNMRGTYHKRRKISDELVSAKPYNMHVIGSQEMCRLWNMKPSQKFNTPDLVKYLSIPEENQAESFKNPNYSFRVLRLLRKSPHFFEQTAAVIQSLDGYLKQATNRIFKNGIGC